MNRQKIGVQYNKPFNIFSTLLEEPVDPKMSYHSTPELAIQVLDQHLREAVAVIIDDYKATRRQIIKLGEEMKYGILY